MKVRDLNVFLNAISQHIGSLKTEAKARWDEIEEEQ